MYLPQHFREDRPEVLYEFIRRHPLGALVTGSGVDLTADHLPMQLVTESGDTAVLRGHIARANPCRHRLAEAAPVLVIFGGADQYISPSWYPTKKETGRRGDRLRGLALLRIGGLGLIFAITEAQEIAAKREMPSPRYRCLSG